MNSKQNNINITPLHIILKVPNENQCQSSREDSTCFEILLRNLSDGKHKKGILVGPDMKKKKLKHEYID